MAKYFQLITVDTPTGLTATPQAGGSLPIGTTYYYRVITFRRYQPSGTSDIYMPVMSAPTAEVSATTDSTNRTIQLSWNAVANAFGYIVQRTTTSGSYPVGSGNSLAASGYWAILTTNTLTDDGGVNFGAGNLDHTEAAPLTEVYSDNNDTIEQWEILAQALANGWTHIRCPFPQGIVNSPNNTTIRLALPLFFNGGLYLHDCKFRWRGPIGCINGIFYSAPTVEYVSSGYGDAPVWFNYGLAYPYTTADGKTSTGSFGCYNKCDGTGRIGSLSQFHLARGSTYVNLVYMYQPGPSMQIDGGVLYHRVANWVTHSVNNLNSTLIVGTIESTHNVSNYISLAQTKPASNAVNHNVTFVPENVFYQLGSAVNSVFVDPVFKVNPYQATAYIVTTNYVAITISYTVKIVTENADGNPLSNAKISINDSRGLPATFVLTDADCSSSFNDTDTYTTVSVTNAGSLQIGDIVRVIGSDEHMLVTNIAGSSVTFQRGYNSTPKRKYFYYRRPKFEKLTDVYTDSNGQASVILQSWLLVNKNTGYVTNYIDNLISAGYFDRYYMTPHRLKVEASGYATYECEVEVTEPLSLVVALSPPGGGGGVFLRIR